MLNKYYKILDLKNKEKELIEDFITKEIILKDFEIIINDKNVQIKTNSSNRFVLELNKTKIKDFLKNINLIYI